MRIAPTARWRNDQVELFLLEPQHVSGAYVRWLNDSVTNRYLESRFTTHTLDSTRAFVSRCLADSGTLFLGIRYPHEGQHVGNIKLGPISETHGFADVGILIGEREHWGKGIASAAIAIMIRIAREELRLRKLTAGFYASNIASQKAFLKAGFRLEGRREAHFLLDGKPEAMVLFGCIL